MRRRRAAALLVATFCLAGVALAAGTPSQSTDGATRADATPSDGVATASREITAAPWHRVATAHFALIGDVPARTLRALAVDLEALDALLASLNPDQSIGAPRAQVVVFAEHQAFLRYAPRTAADEPAPVSGFFLSHPHGDFVVVSASAEASVRRVLYHEVLHRFVRHHLPEAPLWLNEGLAEFYSTLEVGRGEAWIGAPVAEHVVHLQRGPRRPLADLLAIATDAREEHGAVQDGAFYAESWALVHHLIVAEDGGRAGIARYAARLRAGEEPSAAFAAEFGDLRALDRRIDDGLRRAPREPLHIAIGQPARYTDLEAPLVAAADLDAKLGWLLSHHSPALVSPARAHFESALEAEPEHAAAITGTGWLEELAEDRDAARQLYARARELDPRDPMPPFLEAQVLLRSASELPDSERRSRATQAMLESARAGYRASLALEPELAETWAGLGAAWVGDPSPAAEGLEALDEAYRRLPTRTDVLHNLVVLEARLGNPERAATLYARLESSGDAAMVESAREALLRVEVLRAERLLREGQTTAAVEIMSRVLQETGDRELQATLQSRLDRLERARQGEGGS